MLSKLLITFSLLFVTVSTTHVYGFYDSSIGECDYGAWGMMCGGGSDGCDANERCTFKRAELKDATTNTYNYIGQCMVTPDFPCTSTPSVTLCDYKDDKCGSSGCPSDSKCVHKYSSKLYDLGGNYWITECSVDYCTVTNSNSVAPDKFGVCVQDTSCDQYCTSDADCDSGQNCENVPGYPQKICTSSSGCNLPSDFNSGQSLCSTATDCANTEFCVKDTASKKCSPVKFDLTTPENCFANPGRDCGIGVDTVTLGTDWPLNKFCNNGAACMDTTNSSLDWSATDGYYPTKGICVNCTKPGDPCTIGDVQGTSYTDSCCNSNQKCIVAEGQTTGTCEPKPTYSYCSSDSSFLTAGSKCASAGFGSEYNNCNKCPIIKSDGSRSYLHPDGDEYCHPTFNPSSTEFKCDVNAGKCGCAGGSTSCNASGSCEICAGLSSEAICNPSGPADQCCGSPEITCRRSPYDEGTTFRCLSDESEACNAISYGLEPCTNDTQSCCPNDKPYCSAGTCVADFECSPANEGSCCPGFGTICQAGECVPDTSGECEFEDNVLPPAPGYLGPKIGIISDGQNQGLFSAIGAILYPAGIGIGLFFIVRAGYIIMMSEGSPDEVKRGQEYLTSAVMGTLFIVLSGSILRIIINTLLG